MGIGLHPNTMVGADKDLSGAPCVIVAVVAVVGVRVRVRVIILLLLKISHRFLFASFLALIFFGNPPNTL